MQTKKNIWKAIILLLPAVVFLSFRLAVHPFYLSVTEIEWKAKEKKMEVSCKFFVDDFQQALFLKHQKGINLIRSKKENDPLIESYIQTHLQLKMGNQELKLKMIGHEMEQEAIWVFLEASVPEIHNELHIQNSLFCEALEGQTNLIHFLQDGNRRSYKLLCPDTKLNIDL